MPRPPTIPAAPFRRRLLTWFDRARRELPWRSPEGKADPYRVWISEVMLQQTQVATVIPYFQRFIRRFPTFEALAAAREDEVLGLWSGLGYYARGRALLRAARDAAERHGGLPRTAAELRSLPGFGPYTAGAVASIAFGERTPAVDGNATRVLARLLCLGGDPGLPRFRARVWDEAERFVAAGHRPGDFNQALIELGALICRPSAPSCDRCPVAGWCAAHVAGRETSVPRPRRSRSIPALTFATAACRSEGRFVLVRRPPSGLFGGMWAPPSVEVAPGDEPREAISRAISREPFGMSGGISYCGRVERLLTHRKLSIEVFSVELERPPGLQRGQVALASPCDIQGLAIPTAFRAALALVDARGAISARGVGAAKEGGLLPGSKASRLRPLAESERTLEHGVSSSQQVRRKKIKRIRESA